MKRRNIIILSLALLSFLLVGGCGEAPAPRDATITITSEGTVTDGGLTAQWHSTIFTISVKDAAGYPLNDVKIWISYPWAVPDAYRFVQLYDDTTPKDSPFSATTDENGVYNLRFDFLSGGGLEYYGDLEVRSGSVYSSAAFEVKAPSTE